MKRRSVRNVLVLFFAVFVTTAVGLAAIQANDMVVKMAMASDMGGPEHGGCTQCLGGDDNAKGMTCAAICGAPVLALLPQAAPVVIAPNVVPSPTNASLLSSRTPPLDPYPPRTTDIG
jgi:hypothetical protein